MGFTKWELEQRERRRYDRIFETDFLDSGGNPRALNRFKHRPTLGEKEMQKIMRDLAQLAVVVAQINRGVD